MLDTTSYPSILLGRDALLWDQSRLQTGKIEY